MATFVTYRFEDPVATITMDDGKVNAMSVGMLQELNAALDRAEADQAVVVLSGRPGVFSAGFDLAVLRTGGSQATAMLRSGFELAERVLAFPTPVAMACTGHAMAMGVFLLLCGDYRVGASGTYKLAANEVAIGLTMPHAAIEILRQRLAPAPFNRAVLLAEPFSPASAIEAGFLDRVVEPSDLPAVVHSTAVEMSKLDMRAHAATKLRARARTLTAIKAAIDADLAAFRGPAFSQT